MNTATTMFTICIVIYVSDPPSTVSKEDTFQKDYLAILKYSLHMQLLENLEEMFPLYYMHSNKLASIFYRTPVC